MIPAAWPYSQETYEAFAVMKREPTVKGSGGVCRHGGCHNTLRQGAGVGSAAIHVGSHHGAGMVDELIRTLALAAEYAKKMPSGRSVSPEDSCPRTARAHS